MLGLLAASVVGFAQTARVQVIHNAPDLAIDTVDIWIGNTLALDDFGFREASAFTDVTAGTPIEIRITDRNSVDTTNPAFLLTTTLMANVTYVAIANGIVSTTGYSNTPPLSLDVFAPGQEQSASAGEADVLIFHGSPDAPPVDVSEVGVGAGPVINNIAYGQFDPNGYQDYIPLDYTLQVLDQTGAIAIREYATPLATLGLADSALVAVASGFLNPAANSNGPAFGIFVALPGGGDLIPLPEISASVQVIHNSADAGASSVDIYVQDPVGVVLAKLEDVSFRTASGFVDVPASLNNDIQLTVGVAADTSTIPGSAIYTLPVNPTADENYYAVANGIVSSTGYSPNVPFSIALFPGARLAAQNAGQTDLAVFHGATDAPTVDAFENLVLNQTAVDNRAYGTFDGYLSLPTNNYSLLVQDQTGTVSVREFGAPLQALGLQDAALLVLASGFLDPSANSNGAAFGLYAALPSGGNLVPLPMSTASVQVVHNSADQAASTVDVYVQDPVGIVLEKLEDVDFQSASGFVDVPASLNGEVELNFGIAADTSTVPGSSIFDKPVTPIIDESYYAVANGIVSMTGYTPLEPFDIYLFAGARQAALNAANTDIAVFHGATDAPPVDAFENDVLNVTAVDNLEYGNFDGYVELPTDDYRLMIQDSTGSLNVREFAAPLQTFNLQGGAALVVASGFLNPVANSDGSAFGLYAVLPTGGVFVELPMSTGDVQVIHNSADLDASTVDVYVEGPAGEQIAKLEDVDFRSASPFLALPAEVDLTLHVADENSTDFTNSLFDKGAALDRDENYIVTAHGIVSTSGYDPGANDRPFDLNIYVGARTAAANTANTDILVFHGSTDAPTVDIYETSATPNEIVDDLQYATYRGYLELPTADYILDIRDSTGTSSVAEFDASLVNLSLQGEAITVLASGFLTPGDNSNGPSFGLWAATTAGGPLVELPQRIANSVRENLAAEGLQLYPNPARDQVVFEFASVPSPTEIQVFDLTGKVLETQMLGIGESRTIVDVSSLAPGAYIYRVQSGASVETGRIAVVR